MAKLYAGVANSIVVTIASHVSGRTYAMRFGDRGLRRVNAIDLVVLDADAKTFTVSLTAEESAAFAGRERIDAELLRTDSDSANPYKFKGQQIHFDVTTIVP